MRNMIVIRFILIANQITTHAFLGNLVIILLI